MKKKVKVWTGSNKKKTVTFWAPVKKHKSQNRIMESTGVYLMANFPFFMLNKFGISDEVKNRTKNVSDTTPGVVFTLLSIRMPWGYEIEQWVHNLYRLQNVKFWTGSGRTEWFLNLSPVVGISALIICRFLNIEMSLSDLLKFFFTPFIWLDGVFWLLFFSALKYIFIFGSIFFVLFLLAHLK